MSKTKTGGAERPVIVTTAHRGVFFGYAEGDTSGATVQLKRARMCIRWTGTRGFMGLASDGPNESCRIGPAVDAIELRAVTAILEVTPAAVEAWEKAPWR